MKGGSVATAMPRSTNVPTHIQEQENDIMSKKLVRGASAFAVLAASAFGASAVAQAQEEQPQGPVVQIGKADDEGSNVSPNQRSGQQSDEPSAPKYWIGLAGAAISPDHVLRAHVDIPEGQGVLVANVVPDSPAAKAGLKQHDIILRANETDLHDMQTLVDLVLSEGAKKGQIALEVLRKGERETVYLTPEERPADAPRLPLGGNDAFGGGFGIAGPDGLPQELLQRFQGSMEFRNFGPGVIVGGDGQGVANIPNGVSVNISKEDGKPTHVTVKRGDESWEVVGDDPESLKKLPEDLRPFVQQLLNGASPMDLHMGGFRGGPMPQFGDGGLRERLERMEKHLNEMRERLNEPKQAPKNDEQSK